ncbi:PfkB family carbohydrate kinase [Kineococcus aurantiacus]|uniref:2-dehydro-3-deoxygluconokinase n=1 Tax=Kineococcus aurantiacus TaxID=37633 RepID=A0A7Y9DMT5_9ACTN|nr:2-dehydro-3-deoxygluconokinase [Kineococcus aurantiacus]
MPPTETTTPSRVVCVGEALVVLTPTDDVPLAEAATFTRSVGGAELNVALTLGHLGIDVAWVSRLGDDGFGEHVRALAGSAGVDVSAVATDPDRPTGLYVKVPGTAADGTRRSRMHYYRSGSAASALSPEFLDEPAVAGVLASAGTVHVSGITPGLSDSAARFCAELARRTRAAGATLSVDLNHRPVLWRGRDDAPLRALAEAADELLLGADEARAVFGTDDPARLRARFGHARRVLLKQEEHGVLVLEPGEPDRHVPALDVDVVEPVGAGDAFAAGYLAARSRGADPDDAVRFGHRCAAAALVVRGDRPAHVPALT